MGIVSVWRTADIVEAIPPRRRWSSSFAVCMRAPDTRLGGHISLFMGSRTLAKHWPKIGAWIREHDER